MRSSIFPKLAGLRYALWGLTVVAGLLLVGLYMTGTPTPQQGGRTTYSGEAAIRSEFTLTDHTGARVTGNDFLGRWQLVSFGFTFCPDVCPTTLAHMAGVLDTLGETADRIAPLFITVDPDRDTPDIMADYVSAFHPRLVGLTGSGEAPDGRFETAFREGDQPPEAMARQIQEIMERYGK